MTTSNSSAFVAEDHPPTRVLLSSMLADIGVKVVQMFEDGESLLRTLDQKLHLPGMIFSDLQMPKVDGIQLIRKLSERKFEGGLFFVSGQDDSIKKSAVEIAKSNGFRSAHAISKPISKSLLIKAVEAHKSIIPASTAPILKNHPNTLENNLTTNSFTNFYQPKIRSLTGEIIGAEALIRLSDPSQKNISPDIFIPIIEKRLLIQQVTLDVIARAAKDLQRINSVSQGFKIAVNLSADCLSDILLPDQIMAICSALSTRPGDFIFEITESKVVDQPILAKEVLSRLRMMGAELSIDDFGTGFSSLKQLLDLPFSELKVDRAFVTGAWTDKSKSAIMQASLGLAKKLGIRTVTEGIETSNDLRFAIQSGADILQGYFISKPVSAAELQTHLTSWDSERKLYWETLDISRQQV